jgi:hypothetical protein
MSDKLTIEEAAESITGFEEIAIERQFGSDLTSLTSTMQARALVFVLLLRQSGDPVAAKNDVMKMTLKAVMGSFNTDEPSEPGND